MKLHHIQSLKEHIDRVWHVRFSPDGNWLASCGGDGSANIWKVTQTEGEYDFKKVACLTSKSVTPGQASIPQKAGPTIRQLAWHPSSRKLATASFDTSVSIFELQDSPSGMPFWILKTRIDEGGHDKEVKTVAWSQDGTLASGGRDRLVMIWKPDGDDFDCQDTLSLHTQDIKCIQFGGTEDAPTLVSASYDNTLRLYVSNGEDWLQRAQVLSEVEDHSYASPPQRGHGHTVWAVRYKQDGTTLASADGNGVICLWDDRLVSTMRSQGECSDRPVYDMAWHGDHLIAACADNSLTVFSTRGGMVCEGKELAHTGEVNSVDVMPGTGLVVSGGDDGLVKIWRME
eukprot:gnl/Dysnectes_brevis/762_a837_4215.p1 GENE.gnl/Dysnectes_brevis/762_a837_4215~~gnl/Dysnectes_brevis/762_a837_4215.p1  ORF type:complete len:343 (-),score=70.86 gnl/Dysnectes_brevis/762_a837_4215:79-1107(-)